MKLTEKQWIKLTSDVKVNVSPLTTSNIYKGSKVVTRKLDGQKYTVEPIEKYYGIFSTSQLRTFLTQGDLSKQRKGAIEGVLIKRGALVRGGGR